MQTERPSRNSLENRQLDSLPGPREAIVHDSLLRESRERLMQIISRVRTCAAILLPGRFRILKIGDESWLSFLD
jgi:hypothetical protein